VSLGRINAIMDKKPGIRDSATLSCITGISGKIELKNLTFSYPGARRPALRNISVTIEKGKTLAVVGRTGSGKTTLLNLILRLYNVEDGMLLIDDTHINRIPLQVLRSNIAYVPQDTFLFSTTIRENMDFFGFRDEDSIIEASQTAGIHNDIMDFPDKFDTLVGERGVTLSGGQKQRIAIARAILRSPSILILDDCLSAVDTATEEKILKSLKQIMSDRTSIIVSHRISAVRDADEIIVLEEGGIAERGTHESLLADGGIYSSLYHKQLLAEQIDRID
jgi:ATP-binding cassette subfamily B multidrug efflux pump